MEVAIGVVVVLAILVVIVLCSAIKILREYERGVIFRLGRLIAQKGPGLILLIPIIDRMVRVDLRTVTLNIPPQEVITRDNVPSRVNAVAYFRVIDPNKAIVEVENYLLATSQISQTALRSVLGKAELDQLLSERERLNEELQKIIDESTEPWGVKVTAVEIKDVEIPEQMQRAMARQAEAERERRAKIINSEGEYQAAQKLTDAADIISTNSASLQLRYLQTLLEIGSNQNTTIVFPLPMDVIKPFLGWEGDDEQAAARVAAAAARTNPPPPPPPPPRFRSGRRGRPSALTLLGIHRALTISRGRDELSRAPHRPADGDAHHPRPRPGREARGLHAASLRAEGPRGLPVLRGLGGDDPARGVRHPRRRGGRRAGVEDPGRPQPLPGAGRRRRGARRPPPEPGPNLPSAAPRTRCGPPRGRASRTCSPRARRRARTR